MALCFCGAVALGALAVGPKVLLAYRSAAYVFGTLDPPGGPYRVVFGTDRPEELRGGRGDDLLASEGPWGDPPEDYGTDRLYGGGSDDYLDAVSLPYPQQLPVDVVRCGAGQDAAVADPQDDVGDDCETVWRVDLSVLPELGDPLWDFPPEDRMRQYGPNPHDGRSPDRVPEEDI